jgi:Uma2 family endonuclease
MSIAEFTPASIVADPRPKRWTRKEFDRLIKLDFFDEPVELVDGEILKSRPGTYDDPQWLWTRAALYRLWDLGFLTDKRVQLLEGEIYFMLPQNPPHAGTIKLVERLLERLFGEGYTVRTQMPLDLGLFYEPEPDVAVAVGQPRLFLDRHPTTAVLIVEVSDSTLAFDRKNKGLAYARGDIADYWIVNLIDGCLEVYRQPGKKGYKPCDVLEPGDVVAPLALPKAMIKVSDLLP